MKKHYFVSLLVILSIVVIFFSCGKDDTPVPVGQPVITPTFAIIASDGKSSDVSVKISWTSVNTVRAFFEGAPISPNGDTTVIMEKGEKRLFTFSAQNKDGVKTEEYLTVNIPEALTPTISVTCSLNGEPVDTLTYGGAEGVTISVNFTNGTLYLNDIPYFNSPCHFVFDISETTTYNFEVMGESGIIVELPFTIVVKQLSSDMTKMLFSWRIIKGEESYDSIDWANDAFDYSVIDCHTDDILTFTPTEFTYDAKEFCSGGYDNPTSSPWCIMPDGKFIGLSPQRTMLLPVGETYTWVYYNPAYSWDKETHKFVEIKRWRRETFVHVE